MSKFTRMQSVLHRTICIKSTPLLHHSISIEHRAMRLLSRRYTLTATGYKFLEIGINVHRELRGDCFGRSSMTGIDTRWNIYKLLRNDYKDNFISVGPLTVRIYLMNDVTLVRLESLNVRITMIDRYAECLIWTNVSM
ncbi:hypothetical protein P5V15_005898 [Pogonomyrmex californicus]